MQINDALFPIGGYSHSYGLETYVQKGIVKDGDSARAFVSAFISLGLVYTELLAVRLCYEYAGRGDMESALNMENILNVSRSAKETRAASKKLGSRFIKTVAHFDIKYSNRLYSDFIERLGSAPPNHCTAYGFFCASAGIGLLAAMRAFLYSQASQCLTNCVKLIPLSQTEGQYILFSLAEELELAIDKVMDIGAEELGRTAPALDIRQAQHEGLYSRLYMS